MTHIRSFKRKTNASPEKAIENSILSYLKVKGIFCFKVDTVGIFDPVRKVYRKKNSIHHIKGVSDILGIYQGRMLAIEVKSTKGSTTPEQRAFLQQVQAEGGIALVARSIEDVERVLEVHSTRETT